MKLKLIFHLYCDWWLDGLFIAHFGSYEQFQDAIAAFFYSTNILNSIIEIFSSHHEECSLSLHITHFLEIPNYVFSKLEVVVFKKPVKMKAFLPTIKIGYENRFFNAMTFLAAQKCDSKGIQSEIS